jgi:tRNA (guanine37-N1)-methyltransferase
MRFDIITIFPDFFSGIFANGVLKRALANRLIRVNVHDLRNFTHDKHRTVDDRPFGGGEGMVLKPEPLVEAVESLGVSPGAERKTSCE